MRVLITGATGSLASELADALLARGDEVVGLTRDPTRARSSIAAPVEAAGADATVLGAAALAAVGSGVVSSLSELTEMLPADRKVEPERDEKWRESEHDAWKAFVEATKALDPS